MLFGILDPEGWARHMDETTDLDNEPPNFVDTQEEADVIETKFPFVKFITREQMRLYEQLLKAGKAHAEALTKALGLSAAEEPRPH